MPCDKCHQRVHPSEDATFLDARRYNYPLLLLMTQERHIRCSPSRAQYIVHPDFPPVVDERPEYDKRLRDPREVAQDERDYTAAWLHVRTLTGEGG